MECASFRIQAVMAAVFLMRRFINRITGRIFKNDAYMKNQSQPLVSVIIPTCNPARTIENCMKSVKAETYKNIEILVN